MSNGFTLWRAQSATHMTSTNSEADTFRRLQELPVEFLERYNRQGPRYTSYPTVPEWSDCVGEDEFLPQVREDAAGSPDAPLSLYFHIPFCRVRCLFCACNVIVARRDEAAEPYLDAMDAEMGLIAQAMQSGGDGQRPVVQIHFGGGNPNFLSPDQMARFTERIRARFAVQDGAELSLEANPCSTSDEFLRTLAELGFNRISYGVQDFHPKTQEAIGRIQSVETTRRVTELARELEFQGINYDLVYGLPHQAAETFDPTLSKVIELGPDRIALYNFAYLPERLRHQQAIDVETLPRGSEKFRILTRACQRFSEAGYEYIGMDHFARPEDPLAQARRARRLQRNFMGYTTQAGPDLYAFGVTSISMTDRVYVQNTRQLTEYCDGVQAGKLAIERGIVLSADDRIRRDVINELMCHGSIDKPTIEERHGIDFDTYFGAEVGQLGAFEDDGLLAQSNGRIECALLGTIFVRNVAMLFDAYLNRSESGASFSRTL